MSLYPALFMRGILWPTSPYHLRSPWAEPDLLTDFDGAVRLAQIIDAMRWPWSESVLSAAPTGESLLRWQNLSQGIQLGAIYLGTRLAPPTFTVNVIVFVGWVLTGVAAYALARRLGATPITALAAGLTVEMLPSLPTMASNYTSYVYIGVPILVIARTLDMSRAPSQRNLLMLLVSCGVALFFDPYWFFFSLVAVLVGAVANARTLWPWFLSTQRWWRVAVTITACLPVALIVAVVFLDRVVSSSSTSRSLGLADADLIHAGLRSPWHWFRSSDEGVGLVVAVLGMGAIAYAVWRRNDRRQFTAAVITLVFILLSTRTRFETPLFTVGSPAEFARFMLPGVRFFQRSALIAEVLLVIGATLVVQTLGRRVERPGVRLVGVALIVALVLAEFNPSAQRSYQRRWDEFAEFRAVVQEADSPLVIALPFERRQRSWFELGMLGPIPSVNPVYSPVPVEATAKAASRGPGSLAAYLDDLGVTHLLAVVGEEGYPVRYDFEPPRFVRRATIVLDGYEGRPQLVALYEVASQPDDSYCSDCPVGREYEWILTTSVEGDVAPLERDESIDLGWWWATGGDVELEIEEFERGLPDDTWIELTFGNAPCAFSRTVDLSVGSFRREIELRGSEVPTVRVPVSTVRDAGPIELAIEGRPCRIDTDSRDLMIQVFSPRIVSPEE